MSQKKWYSSVASGNQAEAADLNLAQVMTLIERRRVEAPERVEERVISAFERANVDVGLAKDRAYDCIKVLVETRKKAAKSTKPNVNQSEAEKKNLLIYISEYFFSEYRRSLNSFIHLNKHYHKRSQIWKIRQIIRRSNNGALCGCKVPLLRVYSTHQSFKTNFKTVHASNYAKIAIFSLFLSYD